MKFVVDSTQPLFAFLRFADQDKVSTLSEVLLEYRNLKTEYERVFHGKEGEFQRYMSVIDARMHDVTHKAYINAGIVS